MSWFDLLSNRFNNFGPVVYYLVRASILSPFPAPRVFLTAFGECRMCPETFPAFKP